MPSVVSEVSCLIYCYAECRYGECHYAECRGASCLGCEVKQTFQSNNLHRPPVS